MLDIDLNPILFTFGTFEIRWYGVMVTMAVIVLIGISLLEAKRRNIPQDTIWDIGLWGVVGGIVGARLLHIIDKWEYYINHPEQLLNFAGLAVWGAVLGGAVAMLIYCLVKKMSFWKLGDTVAPGAIMAQAIGRVGCLVNGCCYGAVCELPISVIYLNPNSYAPHGVPVYPTQIFHIVWNVIGFVFLWLIRKKIKPEGALFLVWLIYFSLGDFAIRFFRGDATPFMFNLPEAQVIDIAVVVVAAVMLVVLVIRDKKAVRPVEVVEASKSE
ncbi:MAG: prolipoprotein diacylglyceryl transferase [Dehalococcoidia bacterium]|nr:MAG: prolipoprotein diacylglyceryl transferase [Dehalococcoidia bacterium]